ncbi:MAG: DNA-binding protein [Candidatus Woesearchaeota archaeon]
MDELEALRQRRMSELQQQAAEEEQIQQQITQIEALVKSKMTKEAVSRYSTLRSVHPDKATQALLVLAQLIQAKQVTTIDDEHFKLLLSKINPEKREMTITRK